jgi:hypothetical protein
MSSIPEMVRRAVGCQYRLAVIEHVDGTPPWLGGALARAALGDGLTSKLRPAARLGEPS